MLPLEGVEELLERARKPWEEEEERAASGSDEDQLLLQQEASHCFHNNRNREGAKEDLEVSVTFKLSWHGAVIQGTTVEAQ